MSATESIAPVTIVVEGNPVGQPRRDVDPRTKRGYYKDPKGAVRSWKGRVKVAALGLPWELRTRMSKWREEGLAMEVAIQFRMPRPRTSKLERPTSKPDWDNLAKGTQDALEDVKAIGNDSRIVKASVYKRWAREGEAAGATIMLAPFQGE